MAARCRAAEVKGGKRRPALLKLYGDTLCEACERWARRCLLDFPHAWCKLKLTLGERQSGAGSKVSYTPTPGVPVNVDADALMGVLVEVAGWAAQAAADSTGASRSGGLGRGYASMCENVAFAEVRFADMVACRTLAFKSWDESGTVPQKVELSGLDIARRIVDAAARSRSHLGESVRVRREPLPCPRCGTPRVLVREVQDNRGRVSASDGSATPEVVRCMACGEQWAEADYRWLSRLVLGEKEGRKMLELAQWLIAEARWQRDCMEWLVAERDWALNDVAQVIGISGGAAAMLTKIRSTVAVGA